MKKNIVRFAAFALILVVVISACKKEKSSNEPSSLVKKFLEMRSHMFAGGNAESLSGNFMDVVGIGMMRNKSLKLKYLKCDTIISDSVIYDTTGNWYYQSCAQITEIDNGNGTFTTIYDYGTGCDEYGSLTSGKITYTWSNIGNSYYSKVVYENYSSYGSTIDGFSEYNFTSDGNSYFEFDSTSVSGDDADSNNNEEPDVVFYWSGSSTSTDNITITFETGESYHYESTYASQWLNNSYTVTEGNFHYTSLPDGYEYSYSVDSPLFYNFECPDTWIAVSGVETIHYTSVEGTTDFSVDYGNGECDNLALVTENGETSVVDFGDFFYTICGDCDGTVYSDNGKKRR